MFLSKEKQNNNPSSKYNHTKGTMTRSTYKFGTPWSTVKAVTFPRPRRLFQNSGASRRGSVVGNVLSLMNKTSITSRNSRIGFPFTVTDQENLRVAVQELTKQKATSQIPTTATTESTITVTSNSLTQLRKKGSKKFVLSFSNISNSTKSSSTSTPKKSKSNTPAVSFYLLHKIG